MTKDTAQWLLNLVSGLSVSPLDPDFAVATARIQTAGTELAEILNAPDPEPAMAVPKTRKPKAA